MSFTKMTGDVLNVSALDNKPSCSATELKATFDEAGSALKTFINNLIDELIATTAPENIGADIEGITTKTLKAVIDNYKLRLDAMYTKLETDTLISQETNSLIDDFDLNLTTGVITITYKDGTTETFDTALEKVPATFALEEIDGVYYLVITNVDGSSTQTDVSDLFNEYVFNNSDEISFNETTSGGAKHYTATIRANSIGINKLSLSAISQLEGYVSSAAASATAAATSASSASDSATSASGSATAASDSASAASGSATAASSAETNASAKATEAESYAKGGTGTREGEDTDNAKYYKEQAEAALSGKQDILTFDDTPTANSTNPVKSGGVKTYVDTQVGNIDTLLTNLNSGGGVE